MRCWYLVLVAQVRMVVGVLPIICATTSMKTTRGNAAHAAWGRDGFKVTSQKAERASRGS
jgi:hypothetical protein